MAIRIAVDLMGGDNAPGEQLKGALEYAAAHPEKEIILVGLPETMPTSLPVNVRFVECGSVMAMDESVDNLSKKRDSSIWVATKLVKDGEADAIISCGSTGAQMAAALLLLKRIKGISRPAVGVRMPSLNGGSIFLDSGANVECTAEQLLQFGFLGSVYAEVLYNRSNPKVALLVNGTEEHKGRPVDKEAHQLMKSSSLNFIGNIEGRDLLTGITDVVVTDGFTGNVVIKTIEGVGKTLFSILKEEFTASLPRKLAAAVLKPAMGGIKGMMDYKQHGGAPLLGVNGVSIVCHGRSDAAALAKGIEVAVECVEKDFVGETIKRLAENTPEEVAPAAAE